jgi:type II secretion system protein I
MWRPAISISAPAVERLPAPLPARRRRRRAVGDAGFTLIEVIVALTVIAFAFVGLLGLHNRNIAMIASDQDLTRATLLARQFITEMELAEFPEVGVQRGEFANAPGFVWEADVQDTELPSVRRVDLRVIWDERNPNACQLVYFIRDRREADEPF